MISRTPLRVSFVGGGSDLVSHSRQYGGAVVSTTIDKYIYVVVTDRFENDIRISYSKTEIVPSIDRLRHELAREAMRMAGLPRGVELVTIADVPSQGTGLGSSSAVTVGMLNALYAYQGILKSPAELAADASEIEIDILRKPIGRQDQYACAYGGFQLLKFGPGDHVTVEAVVLTEENRGLLERNLLMFYTGRQRASASVLDEIDSEASGSLRPQLGNLRELALDLYQELGKGNPDVLGEFLHRGWEQKRRIRGVTTPKIERWYEAGRAAGAIGGKLLGAGGGGFLLFYVPLDRQQAVRAALSDLREVPVRLETSGSQIMYVGR